MVQARPLLVSGGSDAAGKRVGCGCAASAIMAGMNDTPLARIEARIAGLVEGAFSHVFGSPGGLQAIVVRLSAALDGADTQTDPPPTRLLIAMRPSDLDALHQAWPHVEDSLALHLAEQRTLRGRPSTTLPEIVLQADDTVSIGTVLISVMQQRPRRDLTGALPRVARPVAHVPDDALLLAENGVIIPLRESVITLGRAPECTIVLQDPYVSRQHAQICLRGTLYVLLDAGSQSGTFVNGATMHEHVLHSGDVIRLGRTVFIYQDQQPDDVQQATQPMPPRLD